MGKERQEEAESQKLRNTGRNQIQVSWALVCSCNSVYDIYLETTERVWEGQGWRRQRRAGSRERQGVMSTVGRKEKGEKERGSRGVCKIGRKISSVFKLVGVGGRKELGLAGEQRWTRRQRRNIEMVLYSRHSKDFTLQWPTESYSFCICSWSSLKSEPGTIRASHITAGTLSPRRQFG